MSADQNQPLQAIEALAGNAAANRAALHTAIRHARAQGHTLREVAEAAGISHEQVRRIEAV